MDVFIIPAGPGRHELYCEIREESARGDQPARRGWKRRLFDQFSSLVSHVETARHDAAERRAARTPRSLVRRIKDRVVCWLAEAIAEQRLLWHLRGESSAILWYPDDLAEAWAGIELRRILKADADRHLRWLIIDAAGLLIALVFTLIPGPNLLGYYFAFRVVGHYLSLVGARHGLTRVAWQMRANPALTEIRAAIDLDPETRRRHVADIASRLRLQHLAAFLERVAVPAP